MFIRLPARDGRNPMGQRKEADKHEGEVQAETSGSKGTGSQAGASGKAER